MTKTTAPQPNLPVAERPAEPRRDVARSPDLSQPIALVEALASEYSLTKLHGKGHLERAILLSRGMRELREAVKPLLPDIMELMNHPLGFLTDRDPRRLGKDGKPTKPYGEDVVRDCLIQALLKGLYPINNEWNIISARQYTTKEGFERLVRDYPGLTDLDVAEGLPRTGPGGAVVPMRASWRLNSVPMRLRNEKGAALIEVAVRLNAGMGADAAIGKALRKTYSRVYRKLTGTDHSEGDVGELDFPTLSSEDATRLLEQARAREQAALPAARQQAPSSNGGYAPVAAPNPDKASPEQLRKMSELSRELHWEESEFLGLVASFRAERPDDLSRQDADSVITEMVATLKDQQEAGSDGATT